MPSPSPQTYKGANVQLLILDLTGGEDGMTIFSPDDGRTSNPDVVAGDRGGVDWDTGII
jgi:hypothetical protein